MHVDEYHGFKNHIRSSIGHDSDLVRLIESTKGWTKIGLGESMVGSENRGEPTSSLFFFTPSNDVVLLNLKGFFSLSPSLPSPLLPHGRPSPAPIVFVVITGPPCRHHWCCCSRSTLLSPMRKSNPYLWVS